jgi:hypothetical protein
MNNNYYFEIRQCDKYLPFVSAWGYTGLYWPFVSAWGYPGLYLPFVSAWGYPGLYSPFVSPWSYPVLYWPFVSAWCPGLFYGVRAAPPCSFASLRSVSCAPNVARGSGLSFPIKTYISNVVCTIRFWNNLRHILSLTVSGITFVIYCPLRFLE